MTSRMRINDRGICGPGGDQRRQVIPARSVVNPCAGMATSRSNPANRSGTAAWAPAAVLPQCPDCSHGDTGPRFLFLAGAAERIDSTSTAAGSVGSNGAKRRLAWEEGMRNGRHARQQGPDHGSAAAGSDRGQCGQRRAAVDIVWMLLQYWQQRGPVLRQQGLDHLRVAVGSEFGQYGPRRPMVDIVGSSE